MYKHTFAICAYKESEYLEECIKSLVNQEVPSNIILATSTPNDFIKGLCDKYGIEMYVNTGDSGITQDWNFAYAQADAEYVTIAHQDDVYEPDFLEKTLKYIGNKHDFIIAFTDYYEIRNDKKVYTNKILKVKRMMLAPLKKDKNQSSKFIRRRILSIGCPICCPAATYNKVRAGKSIFDTNYINSCDYKTWCDLAELNGEFIYIDKPLLGHRIYAESATSKNLGENIRKKEDLEIMSLYWPKFIANGINSVYALSEKSNKL